MPTPERLLVNFFYAHPVGHAVEALHYCLGHHLADPTREVSVVLNAASAVELAAFCPFVAGAYAVHHPLLEPCPDSPARILDDFRRAQDVRFAMFPVAKRARAAARAGSGSSSRSCWWWT